MCVVADTALFEPDGIVSMDLCKTVTLMAVETAALKDKTATPVQSVTLGALHAGNRRMLVKGLKAHWRIRAHKKTHFLFATFPQQNQRVRAWRHFQRCVKHVRKG